MASSWYKVSFKYIFIHHWSILSKISKKYETSQYESSHSAWYETEHQFSFEVFDNFSKVYVSVEDLAVRIMHVHPDRLLFMFDERILIFLKSDSFYLPSVKTRKMAANPLKKTEILRYTTEVPAFRPFFQRYGWTQTKQTTKTRTSLQRSSKGKYFNPLSVIIFYRPQRDAI